MTSDSPSIKALKKLIRERYIPQKNISKFVREVSNKGPRTCAILWGVFFDTLLELALSIHLGAVHERQLSNREKDDLFGPDMQLGSFSSKITMAYSLKLITPRIRTKLDYIRQIRNVYAHTIQPIPFSRKELRDAITVVSNGIDMTARAKRSTKSAFLVSCTIIAMEVLSKITSLPVDHALPKPRGLDPKLVAKHLT